MTRRSLIACLAVVLAAACGDDNPTAPSLPPTGTAPYSVTDLRVGTGATASTGQRITVSHSGWLYSDTAAENKGSRFDAGTIGFTLGADNIIQGWHQGIPGMRVGGLRRLVLPPELAYGPSTPDPGRIPPNATLLFEVELISIP